MVVLPLVPVMPTTASDSLGRPHAAAAAGPSARRVSSTTIWGTSMSTTWSTKSATAPASTARWAKVWPSTCAPRTQANSTPGDTRDDECVMPVDGGGARPRPHGRRGPTAAPSRSPTATRWESSVSRSRRNRSSRAAAAAPSSCTSIGARSWNAGRRGGAAGPLARDLGLVDRHQHGDLRIFGREEPDEAGIGRLTPAFEEVRAVLLGHQPGTGLAGDRQPGNLRGVGGAIACDTRRRASSTGPRWRPPR